MSMIILIQDDYVPPFVQPPDAGAFWDVFVTTTNEPDHFVVVPLAEIRKLNDLIENLHTEYEVRCAICVHVYQKYYCYIYYFALL